MKTITTYQMLPITITRGEGVWLYDEKDIPYFDSFCGIGVTSLGHSHPAISEAIADQAQRLIHTSNVFQNKHRELLCERLTALAGMDQIFFSNSGAEANEAAIKLARLYGHKRGITHPEIIVMEGAFHGRTLATLSAGSSRKAQAGYEPLVPGFIRAPYNDLDALRHIAEHSDRVVAILVEPIQGEGGVILPKEGYLAALRKLCDDTGWLLMVDEVQTGIARTGSLFAFQQENIVPDVLALAKALGNGYPIGACLMRGPANDLFQPGNHGSTFGGNPLACRIALTVLDIIEQHQLVAQSKRMGETLLQAFKSKLGNHPAIQEIRGKGLMIGIECKDNINDLRKAALSHQLLTNITADKVLRLLPPLIMTPAEGEELVQRVVKLFS